MRRRDRPGRIGDRNRGAFQRLRIGIRPPRRPGGGVIQNQFQTGPAPGVQGRDPRHGGSGRGGVAQPVKRQGLNFEGFGVGRMDRPGPLGEKDGGFGPPLFQPCPGQPGVGVGGLPDPGLRGFLERAHGRLPFPPGQPGPAFFQGGPLFPGALSGIRRIGGGRRKTRNGRRFRRARREVFHRTGFGGGGRIEGGKTIGNRVRRFGRRGVRPTGVGRRRNRHFHHRAGGREGGNLPGHQPNLLDVRQRERVEGPGPRLVPNLDGFGRPVFPKAPPRRLEPLFQIPGEAGRVEQRVGSPIFQKPRPDGGQRVGIPGQPEGQGLVSGQIVGHQLRQPRGPKQAGRNPGGEMGAGQGHHRQTGPQGVAGGGVAVDDEGVQPQVGQPVPGQMGVLGHGAAADDPLARNPPGLGRFPKTGFGGLAPGQQPQHASGHGAEQPHPDVENLRRQFVHLVEGAKNEGVLGQVELFPGKGPVGDGLPVVVDLIGVGHVDGLFGIKRQVRLGRDDPVGDHVVDEFGARGAGKAQPFDLDRRGPEGGDFQPVVLGVPLEFHQDVHLVFVYPLGGRLVGQGRDVHETVAVLADPPAVHAGVLLAVGIAVNPEPVPVVAAEQPQHEVGGGVVVKIVGQVADGQLLPGNVPGRQVEGTARALHPARHLPAPAGGHREIPLGVAGAGQAGEGRFGRTASLGQGLFRQPVQGRPGFARLFPHAKLLIQIDDAVVGPVHVGLNGHRLFVGLHGLFVLAGTFVGQAEVVEPLREAGGDLHGFLVAADGLGAVAPGFVDVAQVVPGFVGIGLDLQHPAVAGLGLFQPAQAVKDGAHVPVGRDGIGLQGQHPLVAGQGALGVAGRLPGPGLGQQLRRGRSPLPAGIDGANGRGRQIQRNGGPVAVGDFQGPGRSSRGPIVPDGKEGPLQVPDEPGRIEQRANLPIFGQFRTDGPQFIGMGRQPHRGFLVGLRVRGRQFGQTRRRQQPGRHPGGEMAALHRHRRHAGAKNVAGGGVAVDRKRVQRQIGQLLPGQMLGLADPFGENEPIRVQTPVFRRPAKVGLGRRVAPKQPQNGAGNPAENGGPAVEQGGRDLVALVEGAEDEPGFGKAGRGPVRRRSHGAEGLVGLIGVGQVDRPLGEERGVFRRQDDPVGENVVHEGGAGGSGIAQKGDLDRRGPKGENLQPAVEGVAHQVHQNVHPVRPDGPGRVGVAQVPDVEKAIRVPLDPAAVGAAVVGSVGIDVDPETVPVVGPEKPLHQVAHRMVLEIVGEVADHDGAVLFGRPMGKGRHHPRRDLLDSGRVHSGHGQVPGRIFVAGQVLERAFPGNGAFPEALVGSGVQPGKEPVHFGPFAGILQLVDQGRQGLSVFGPIFQNPPKFGDGLRRQPLSLQRVPQVEPGFGVVGIGRQNRPVFGNRAVDVAVELAQVGQVEPGHEVVRPGFDGPGIGGPGLGEIPHVLVDIADIVVGLDQLRIEFQGPPVGVDGLRKPPPNPAQTAQAEIRPRGSGGLFPGGFKLGLGLVQPPEGLQQRAQVQPRLHVIGFDPQRLPIAFLGRARVLQVPVQIPQVEPGLGMTGVPLQQPPVGGGGLAFLSRFGLGHGQVEKKHRIFRRSPQGPADVFHATGVVAPLMEQKPQQVKRVGMAGRFGQNLPVQDFRPVCPPLLVKGDRLVEPPGNIHGLLRGFRGGRRRPPGPTFRHDTPENGPATDPDVFRNAASAPRCRDRWAPAPAGRWRWKRPAGFDENPGSARPSPGPKTRSSPG